jgi:uroporphyrin-III C-methyltransferase / precorrin-2 dehydrogenase / sirohydrochlorin ferrochelatase
MYLPLLFKNGLSCLIVGGGQVASRKIEALVQMPCTITIIAPHISDLIAEEVRRGSVRWLEREYILGDCKGFQLVIAATPFRKINRQVSDEARELGIPINVVDDPALSTVIFPAVWRDRSLLVAVSTEGTAPFVAAEIRTRLAGCAQGMGRWVAIGGRFREVVRKEVKNADERKNLYQQFLDAGLPDESDNPPDSNRLNDWLSWLNNIRKLHGRFD